MLIKDMSPGAKFVHKDKLFIVSDQRWPDTEYKKIYDLDGQCWVFDENQDCKLVHPGFNRGVCGPVRYLDDLDPGTLIDLNWMVTYGPLLNVFSGETKKLADWYPVSTYPKAFVHVTL